MYDMYIGETVRYLPQCRGLSRRSLYQGPMLYVLLLRARTGPVAPDGRTAVSIRLGRRAGLGCSGGSISATSAERRNGRRPWLLFPPLLLRPRAVAAIDRRADTATTPTAHRTRSGRCWPPSARFAHVYWPSPARPPARHRSRSAPTAPGSRSRLQSGAASRVT